MGFVEGGKVPRAVVEIDKVVEVAVPPGVRLDGLKLALEADGSPLAEKVTALGKPPVPGVNEMVKLAVCPAVIVTGVVGPAAEKSMPVPVSVMFCALGVALSFNVSVSGPTDPAAVGVKVMLMTHWPPPPRRLTPLAQVVPGAMAQLLVLVSTVAKRLRNDRVSPPLLVTVICFVALVVPTP